MKTTSWITIGTILLLIGTACSDKKDNRNSLIVSGRFQPESTSQTSMGKAMSTGDETQSASGAVVTAAEITANGSFRAISGVQTTTDASGRFSLAVDAASAQHIVIRIERAGEVYMGYVSNRARNSGTYVMKTVDVESTVETEIHARLVAEGKAAGVGKADVDLAVSADLASSIRGNTTAVATVAAAIASAAQARAEFYSQYAQSQASQRLEALMSAQAQAYVVFETNVNASTSVEQRSAAREVLLQAAFQAHVTGGLTVSQAAQLLDASVRVYTNAVAGLSTTIRDEARASVALMHAIAMSAAIEAEASASGFSQATVNAVAQAGVQLKSTVKTGSRTVAAIRATFESYAEDVRSAIEADGSAEAQAYAQISVGVNAQAGAGTVFMAAVSGSVNAQVMTSAYATFVSSVRSLVQAQLTSATQARIDAVTRVVVLSRLCRP